MRCFLCGRAIVKSSLTVGPPIGPKCAKRAGLVEPKRKAKEDVVRDKYTRDWVKEMT